MNAPSENLRQDQEVLDRILELMRESAKADTVIGPDTRILADTSFDSVSVMDFVLELEDEFDVTIPLNNLADVETIGQLADAIEKLRGDN